MKISDPHPLLDPYRYFGYLFEKNAYPDVLDTCSKKEYVSGCFGYLFGNEYISYSSRMADSEPLNDIILFRLRG